MFKFSKCQLKFIQAQYGIDFTQMCKCILTYIGLTQSKKIEIQIE